MLFQVCTGEFFPTLLVQGQSGARKAGFKGKITPGKAEKPWKETIRSCCQGKESISRVFQRFFQLFADGFEVEFGISSWDEQLGFPGKASPPPGSDPGCRNGWESGESMDLEQGEKSTPELKEGATSQRGRVQDFQVFQPIPASPSRLWEHGKLPGSLISSLWSCSSFFYFWAPFIPSRLSIKIPGASGLAKPPGAHRKRQSLRIQRSKIIME